MIKPVAKYIALTKIVEDVIAESGMKLTAKESSEMRYQKGVVLAVGDEITNVKKDDVILFDQSNSYTMLVDSSHITFIQYREVVSIF